MIISHIVICDAGLVLNIDSYIMIINHHCAGLSMALLAHLIEDLFPS